MRKEFGPNASIQDVKDRQGGVTVSMSLDNFKGGKKEPDKKEPKKEPPKKESKGNKYSTKFSIGDKVRFKHAGGQLSPEIATITGHNDEGYYTFTWDDGTKDEGSSDVNFALVGGSKVKDKETKDGERTSKDDKTGKIDNIVEGIIKRATEVS